MANDLGNTEIVSICETCHKKIQKDEDLSTTMVVSGVVYKFCSPVCAVVFEISIEVNKPQSPIPELQKH